MNFYGWKLPTGSPHLCIFIGRWSSASGDIICLIFHVISQDHVIEGSYYFVGGRSSLYVPTLPFLAVIDIMIVVIPF